GCRTSSSPTGIRTRSGPPTGSARTESPKRSAACSARGRASRTRGRAAPMAGPKKVRLDRLLVDRGLVESRTRAQALIMAGQVVVGENRVDKPGQLVPEDAPIRIRGQLPYVSRGALKLEKALDTFGIDPTGLRCVD